MKLPKEPVPLWPDAGGIIGLGRTKMFEVAAAGLIETFKVGRKQFVKPTAIDAFIKWHCSHEGEAAVTKAGSAAAKKASTAPPLKQPAKKAPAKKVAAKGAPATPPAAVEPPLSDSAFGARGRRLWDAYCDLVDGQRGLVLLEESCRTADRLDRLEALLQGDVDVWARLVHNLRTQDYELRIDSALIEARQQGAALRQLIAALPLKESDDGDDDEGDWTAGL